ncbi:MAG TPA: hypothetical protein VGH90_07215 [Chthoniobacteraceae bacterium]|jgi:hypothetical protein
MHSLRWLLIAGFAGCVTCYVAAQNEPAAPAPAAAPEPAPAPAESGFDDWLSHPASAPVPPREEVEKYLGNLQQRQQDLTKVLDFVVSRKRMRKDQASRETAAVTVPPDITMEHWDELEKTHKAGNLSDKDYGAAVASFAARFREIDLAQEALSHKCAQLMAHPDEPARVPVRRARPVESTPPPAATPAPKATPSPKSPPRSGSATPAPKQPTTSAAATPPLKATPKPRGSKTAATLAPALPDH